MAARKPDSREPTEEEIEAGAKALCEFNLDDPDKPHAGGWEFLNKRAQKGGGDAAYARSEIHEYRLETRAVIKAVYGGGCRSRSRRPVGWIADPFPRLVGARARGREARQHGRSVRELIIGIATC